MGRRSRHTAKTGDKSIYKSRSSNKIRSIQHRKGYEKNSSAFDHEDETNDFLKLDGDDSQSGSSSTEEEEEEDDGITKHQEGIFDLGIGGSSDDDNDDDDDDSFIHDSETDKRDTDGDRQKRRVGELASSSEDDDDDDDSEDEDEDNFKSKQLFNWGDKKHSYYHGDTADLEIGQDVEDAYLEEEAGREVEKARLEDMDDTDFMLGYDDGNDDADKNGKINSMKQKTNGVVDDDDDDPSHVGRIHSIPSSRHNLLSKSDKIKFLKTNHPELLPLVHHFSQQVHELSETTIVAAGTLLKQGVVNGVKEAKAVGTTSAGLQYLITKSMLQASNALNLSLYLLLKADLASRNNIIDSETAFVDDDNPDEIRNHPVMDRLNTLSQLTDKIKEGVEDKIPGLRDQVDNLVKAAALMEGGDLSSSDDGESSAEEGTLASNSQEDDEFVTSEHFSSTIVGQSNDNRCEEMHSSDSEDERETQEAIQRRIMTEAKFALRNQDIDNDVKIKKRNIIHASSDYGDETEEVNDRAMAASRSLASTMNSILQKSNSVNEKRKMIDDAEAEADDVEFDDLRRGLAMMENDIGEGSESDHEMNGNDDNDEGFHSDEDEFYSSIKLKSKAKKEAKKQMYTVAPKYPRLEGEIDGERSIGKAILKNRGLVAHKPKINRNPRVKKREQYRKALIRRKGAVREIRTDEGHVYGGEATGIKSGISRSRKLGR